jgi:hypothetical protein
MSLRKRQEVQKVLWKKADEWVNGICGILSTGFFASGKPHLAGIVVPGYHKEKHFEGEGLSC